MSLQKPSEPQLSWPDFTTVPSSIWDMPSADPLYSWPTSSSSPTAPTSVRCFLSTTPRPPPLLPHGKLKYVLFWGGVSSQSLLGSSHNPWSASAAFGNSIWSASTESSLHPYSPAVNSPTLTDPLDPSPAPSADMSRTYNPWSMWRPTLGRRSSEPWPSPSEDAN